MKHLAVLSALILAITTFSWATPVQAPRDDAGRKSQQPDKSSQQTSARLRAVPASVDNTGEYAENIYDAAFAQNWKTTAAKLSALKTAVHELPPSNGAAEQLQIRADVQQLEISVTAKDRLATMKHSNQITRLAAELSSQYRRPTPVGVTLLDYQGRQLQIALEANDTEALKRTANDIRQEWDRLRPKVQQRSPQEAEKFGALVTKIESARGQAEYAQLAKLELDEVDKLENVLARPNPGPKKK